MQNLNLNSKQKIYNFESIAEVVLKLKSVGKRVALCHGVFDLLHPGHIQHFEEASKLADYLLISVTSDRYVNKGPGRPLFSELVRAQALSGIGVIDGVIISDQPTAIEIINHVKPDIYIKGPDYTDNDVTGMIEREKEAVLNNGGEIYFTSGFTSSSSKLINMFYSNLSENTQKWVSNFKEDEGYKKVVDSLEKISRIKPLILGELILDQYTSCFPLSKSSKDPILAFQISETNIFPGGVMAIANNCSGWTSEVKVITFAADKIVENFSLVDKLDKKISLDLVFTKDRPTILKHRYVESSSSIRLFEYYDFSDSRLLPKDAKSITNKIKIAYEDYDLIIVADYGHGYFSDEVISVVENLDIFKSVNTQANAGNRGFNTISKYSKADLITFNGAELQLELRDRNPDYFKIVPKIMKEKGSSYAIVTLGGDGLIVFDAKGKFEKVPAFANKLVDKVGAGDAVFAIASLLAKVNAPLSVIGFLSNLVAAHEVAQLGHEKSLQFSDLLKQAKALLG
jgi:rfaE bifunctional protein nucleotidyltransferase chain/domain